MPPLLRPIILALAFVFAWPPGAPLGQPYPYQPYPYQPYPYQPGPYQPYPYQPAPGQPYAPPSGMSPSRRGEAAGGLAAEMVAAHNRARRAVGVPDLRWSPAVAAVAQRWADRLGAEGCRMHHSGNPDYGENLAWVAGQQMSPAQVVQLWVDEARSYNRAANTCAPGAMCGHYIQVVWRSTRFVGCAVAQCADSEVWVCNYDPPGNYVGHRPY